MLVMEEAKLPPPMPVSSATAMKVVYDVPGSITSHAAIVGSEQQRSR